MKARAVNLHTKIKINIIKTRGKFMRVIKRNGETVDFNKSKIQNAILKAMTT